MSLHRRHLVASALVAVGMLGCDRGGGTTAKPAGLKASPGSAVAGSGSSAIAGAPAGSAEPAAACTDQVITKRMDDGFVAITRYFGAIEKLQPRWQDCEVARTDLLALEPEAKQFEVSVLGIKSWMSALDPTCRARVQELGPGHPMALEVEQRFGPLEPVLKATFERCKDHPGFREALGRGFRALHKKK